MQWINHEKEERMAVAAKVIGAVRLGLADIGVVIDGLDTKKMKQLPEIYTQVYEAAIYKHRPSHKPQTVTQQTKQRSKNPVSVFREKEIVINSLCHSPLSSIVVVPFSSLLCILYITL